MSNIGCISPTGGDDHPLIKDKEWSILVERHLKKDLEKDSYATGYRDGQREALQDVVHILSATSSVMADDDKTRQIMACLAAIMALLETNDAEKHCQEGSGS
ncbi:hypothetical protein [Paracoccus pantotrophus]|uniref:hypothetical protein n=1 Tax=Paracoccus pantotrophus TaxID=82367 RepID=UPI00094386BC|nr:hypothetical protein [Paracoccus pantotrophus]MDF3856579.1 hypothetical protein [Paracoccus pantotrophus]